MPDKTYYISTGHISNNSMVGFLKFSALIALLVFITTVIVLCYSDGERKSAENQKPQIPTTVSPFGTELLIDGKKHNSHISSTHRSLPVKVATYFASSFDDDYSSSEIETLKSRESASRSSTENRSEDVDETSSIIISALVTSSSDDRSSTDDIDKIIDDVTVADESSTITFLSTSTTNSIPTSEKFDEIKTSTKSTTTAMVTSSLTDNTSVGVDDKVDKRIDKLTVAADESSTVTVLSAELASTTTTNIITASEMLDEIETPVKLKRTASTTTSDYDEEYEFDLDEKLTTDTRGIIKLFSSTVADYIDSTMRTTEVDSMISDHAMSYVAESSSVKSIVSDRTTEEILPELGTFTMTATTLGEATTHLDKSVSYTTDSSSILAKRGISPLDSSCPIPPQICKTPRCEQSGSRLLSLIKHGVNPCDDFHEYACGGAKINKINLNDDILDIPSLKSDESYVNKFVKYYNSCMSANESESLKKLASIITSVSEDTDTAAKDKSDLLTNLIAKLILLNPYRSTSRTLPLFDIIMEEDLDGKYIPVVTLPSFKSPITESVGSDYYERACALKAEQKYPNKNNVDSIYASYKDCLKDINNYEMTLAKAFQSMAIYSDYLKHQKLEELDIFIMWNVIDEFGTILNPEWNKELLKKPTTTTLYDLSLNYSQINWHKLFFQVFGPTPFPFQNIRIQFPEVMQKIFTFFEKNSYETIKMSLIGMLAHDLYVDYMEQTAPRVKCRADFCTNMALNLMSDVASKLYRDNYSAEDINIRINMTKNVFNESKSKLIELLRDVKWMTEDNIFTSIGQIEEMSLFFYDESDVKFSDAYLEDSYVKYELSDDFIANTMILQRKRRTEMYATNNKSLTEDSYFMSPLDTELKSFHSLSRIGVPLRFLMTTIPHTDLQNYEIYNRLAFALFSEISKLFSPLNIRRHMDPGEIYNLFEESLSDAGITNIDNNRNLTLASKDITSTLSSRFSDAVALNLSLTIYEANVDATSVDLPLSFVNFNKEQLFYLGFSQQFCNADESRGRLAVLLSESPVLENYFRLNSMLTNSVDFADTFNCPLGSSMNPVLKIDPFPFLNVESDYGSL